MEVPVFFKKMTDSPSVVTSLLKVMNGSVMRQEPRVCLPSNPSPAHCDWHGVTCKPPDWLTMPGIEFLDPSCLWNQKRGPLDVVPGVQTIKASTPSVVKICVLSTEYPLGFKLNNARTYKHSFGIFPMLFF
jgi:hypothetical protein